MTDLRTPKPEQAALGEGDYIISKQSEVIEYGHIINITKPETVGVRCYSVRHPDGYVSIRPLTDVWPIDEATFEWVSDCDWQISAMPADLWSHVRDRIAELDAASE